MAGFKGSQSGFSWSKIVAWTAPGMYDGSSPIKVTLCDLWVSYQVTCEMAGGYFRLDDLHQSSWRTFSVPSGCPASTSGQTSCRRRSLLAAVSFAPWHEIF